MKHHVDGSQSLTFNHIWGWAKTRDVSATRAGSCRCVVCSLRGGSLLSCSQPAASRSELSAVLNWELQYCLKMARFKENNNKKYSYSYYLFLFHVSNLLSWIDCVHVAMFCLQSRPLDQMQHYQTVDVMMSSSVISAALRRTHENNELKR